MPITKLDPNAALVLIDLQKGIVGLPTVHPTSEIIARAAQLARAFRERGLPVVLVNVTVWLRGAPRPERPKFAFPEGWTELVPELEKTPTIIWSASSGLARSSARLWIRTYASAA